MKVDLNIYTKPIEGDLYHTYNALQNLQLDDKTIGDFNVIKKLNLSVNNPINIECQPSYDGTVNLILNDDLNPPRIINTRFSKIENNRYKIINRNQTRQSNIYTKQNVDLETRLFRTTNTFPKIELTDVQYGGQLKGGNYVFYIKFADSDENETDIVCESGIVSIFKGVFSQPNSVSGTLLNEETDKAVKLLLSDIDTSFPKFYVYFSRETSDLNGFRQYEIGKFTKPYDITGSSQDLIIYGYEETQLLTEDDLNISYFTVSAAKTQAQVQNMLFLGNIKESDNHYAALQNLSYWIRVSLEQKSESIGWVSPINYLTKEEGSEYYDPKNIYYNLGYWPDELYRLGVVYIMSDDTLSPVFNLRGCYFQNIGDFNISSDELYQDHEKEVIPSNSFLQSEIWNSNSYGVFRNPEENSSNAIHDYSNTTVKPWYYRVSISDNLVKERLMELGVKGLFIVRQKRIPTTLCQGVSIGVDDSANIPALYSNKKYITQSFIDTNKEKLAASIREIGSGDTSGSGLLSLDASIIPEIQSKIDGSKLVLRRTFKDGMLSNNQGNTPHYVYSFYTNDSENYAFPCTFVKENTPYKYMSGYGFSTRIGSEIDVKDFGCFGTDKYSQDAGYWVIRGIYTSFIGVCGQLPSNGLYNIKIPDYSASNMSDYIAIRGNDNSPFYSISNRFDISKFESTDVYRGDCFTATVTIRINRNFRDPNTPLNDIIVDPETWSKQVGTTATYPFKNMDAEKWGAINVSDLNAVPLGMWASYKCLSSYNLGLRSDDDSDSAEMALLGVPKSFYPKQDMDLRSALKLSESQILNRGLSSTTSRRWNGIVQNVPYIKNIYDTRIMFSNAFTEENFRNGYRIFQGLSYKDIDRQYGAIVKILPWGTNLFCVFEHGLGIIPINEKALIQTSTNQSIHMYGAGVIQNQISLISSDFGSIWQDSIIRTPIGIYGVDTSAKKIWRYSESGFETISDMKIQKFLNDHIKLTESDKYPIVSLKNVKTHYNNYKGDLMFTFYNENENETWNFCFNERMDKWITKYSWTPLFSENIDNIFYSLDQNRAKILAKIYDNKNCTYGLRCDNNILTQNEFNTFKLWVEGTHVPQDQISYNIDSINCHYLNNDKLECLNILVTNNSIDDGEFNILKLDKDLITVKYDYLSIWFQKNYKIKIPPCMEFNITCTLDEGYTIHSTLGIILQDDSRKTEIEKFTTNGFYVHGRAGIFNELNYSDANTTNQILPTKWYDRQEPFEFEFIVNGDDVGAHKIFNNLVIISNNVQPKQFEFSVIGDVYNFNKSGIFRSNTFGEDEWINTVEHTQDSVKYKVSQQFDFEQSGTTGNCKIEWDDNQNNYWICLSQDAKNIKDCGRLQGNIHYKEDSWYVSIDPIKFKNKYLINNEVLEGDSIQSTRIRDKFMKVRVKYSGEDLVIITALNTLLTLSYS